MSEEQKKPLFRIRTMAVAEVFVAIGLLVVINLVYFNGDRFAGLNPHPFWFVVILISAQYGIAEGVFAMLVSTVFYLVGNVRPRGENEYIYTYLLDVNAQPLLWLISAVIIGLLRYRHVMERDRLRGDLAEAIRREDVMAAQYEQLRLIREMLEQRLVKHVNTVVDTYKAARLMESLEPGKILDGVQAVVTALLHPDKFSVFMLKEDKLELSLSSAWEANDTYLKTIRSNERLFEEVIGGKRIVCIADGDDELILNHQGMLAGPIMAESGQILGMLKIESIPYTDLTISSIQAFKLVCEWIGTAYFQAEEHQKLSGMSLINPDNNLYSYEYFKRRSEYTNLLAKRFNFDVSVVMAKIIVEGSNAEESQDKGMKMLAHAVDTTLRKADTLFNFQMNDYSYYILLPGASEAAIKNVMERITTSFESQQKDSAKKLKIALSSQILHKKS